MHVDRQFLAWGGFFLVLGAIPLSVRQGWIPASAVAGAWDLWPFILVGVGLHLALRRTSLAALGGLVVAATFGLILGSALATGVWRFGGFGGCTGGDGAQGVAFAPVDGELAGDASVTLDLDCGDLTMAPAAGRAYRLEGEDDDGRGPEVDAAEDSVSVRSRDRQDFFGGTRDAWRMSLGTDPTYHLDIGLNAGSATLDLASMRLRDLVVAVNAGDMTLDLGDALAADELTAHANAGAIRITLPLRDLRGSISANAGLDRPVRARGRRPAHPDRGAPHGRLRHEPWWPHGGQRWGLGDARLHIRRGEDRARGERERRRRHARSGRWLPWLTRTTTIRARGRRSPRARRRPRRVHRAARRSSGGDGAP